MPRLSRLVCFVVTALCALPSFGDAADEVRRAEIAFAKAFADRDQARFFSFVADDATFFGGRTQRGKPSVVEQWSRFFTGPQAPFSWGPERVAVNAAGTIALSTGPVYDASGKHAGSFTTTWTKQTDGSWKVLFDSGGPSPANLAESALETTSGFVETEDGTKLHYRKVGRAPLTVIVPLGALHHDDFKQLADIATVITYDPRGRGRSSRIASPEAYSVSDEVRDLEAVRRHFKLEKFVPIGYSYAGKVVAMYAAAHPERVARVIQLGPAAMRAATKFPAELTHGIDDVKPPEADVKRWQAMRSKGVAAKSPREFCEAQMNVFRYYLVGDPANATRVTATCDLENEWPVNLEPHIARLVRSLEASDVTASQLSGVKAHVLTIHGTKDRNVPYGAGREWAGAYPYGRLVTVPGAGHAMWADDPVAVFSAIRAFLRGEWPMGSERVGGLAP